MGIEAGRRQKIIERLYHLRRKSLTKIIETVSKIYPIEVVGLENIEALRESDGPTIVYFNHLAAIDPFIVLSVLAKHTGNLLVERPVVVPVSYSYVHNPRKMPIYPLMVRIGRMGGLIMPEIMQSYMVRSSSRRDLRSLSTDLSARFSSIVNELREKNPTIIIAPEGHRSNMEKGLLPAERGVGYLVRRLQNGVCLPMGLVYPQGAGRGLNLRMIKTKQSIKVIVGQPISSEKVMEEARNLAGRERLSFSLIAHALMIRLARMLPENLRGVYSEPFLERVLSGQLEQRINPETGRVEVYNNETGDFLG